MIYFNKKINGANSVVVIYKRRDIRLSHYNRLNTNVLIEFSINLYCEGKHFLSAIFCLFI